MLRYRVFLKQSQSIRVPSPSLAWFGVRAEGPESGYGSSTQFLGKAVDPKAC